MQAQIVTIAAQGSPSVIEVASTELPPPGPGEVRLAQSAIGVNYMDVYQRSGAYPLQLPSGLGLEAVGTIEALGEGVTGIAVGDRVAYAGGPPGAYASHRNLPVGSLVEMPAGLPNEQVAAVLMKGMTVEYLLERCRPVVQGEWVLFYAAAGGVGLLAGQWGRSLGARMIGVAGGAEKCALAREHGYEVVFDHSREDIAERVRAITGAGVPVAFDSVGRATFDATPQGRIETLFLERDVGAGRAIQPHGRRTRPLQIVGAQTPRQIEEATAENGVVLAKGGEKFCALLRTGHRKIDMGIERRLGNPENP